MLRALTMTLLLLPVVLLSQENRATLLGTVSDPTGAAVPLAKILIANIDTGVNVNTVSNASGYYEVPFLLPGRYRMDVQASGFHRYSRSGIELVTNQRATIDVGLEVGAAAESITVTAAAPLLETSTASAGQIVDNRRLSALPLSHMNPLTAITFVSGVTNNQGTFAPRPWERNQHAPTVAGAGWNNNEYSIDGFTNSYAGNRAAMVPVSPIVQELRVETSSFDASSGGHMGGFVSASTKSGTNQLHGMLFEMHQQNRWNATNWFTNREFYRAVAAGTRKPDEEKNASGRYNNFGVTVGGPVVVPGLYNGRNRTFFFFGYNGLYERFVRPNYYRMPTDLERQGNFTELLARGGSEFIVYDPNTAASSAGRVIRQPFAGNVIPSSRISPIASKYWQFFPKPNLSGGNDFANNYFAANQPLHSDYYSLFGRVDHNFSERHKTFFRWNDYSFKYNNGDWTGTGMANSANQKSNPGLILDYVFTVNPTTIVNAKAGWGMNEDAHVPPTRGISPSDFGFPSYIDQRAGGFTHLPSIAFSQMPAISGAYGGTNRYHVYSGQSSVTRIQGRHTLKSGFEMRVYLYNIKRPGSAAGSFTFNNSWTKRDDIVSARQSGLEIAGFLLGLPASGNIVTNGGFSVADRWYAGYFQDDLRVTPRLTLNLGLRYEVSTPLTERFNRITRDYDFGTPSPISSAAQAAYARSPLAEIPAREFTVTGGPLFAGVGSTPRTMTETDWNNLMPRLGAAYKVSDRLVVRGGYATYYNTGIGSQMTDGSHYNFSRTTDSPVSIDRGLSFLSNLADPFPAIQPGNARFLEPVGSALGLMTQVGQGYTFADPARRAPWQHRWRAGAQYTVLANWVLEAAYTGSLGRDLFVSRSLSALPQQYWATGDRRNDAVDTELNRRVPNPFAGLVPDVPAYNAATIEKHRLLRPFPHMNGLTKSDQSLGSGSYRDLQLSANKRFAQGWTVMAAFTWQRDERATTLWNEFDSEPVNELSSDDRNKRLVVNGVYDLPFGRGGRFGANVPEWVNRVIGDWQLAGVFQAQGGVPLGFGRLFFNGDYDSIYLPENQRTIDRWFNTDGFVKAPAQQPSSYHVRTNPVRLDERLRGDGMNQWDLSLSKAIALGESRQLRLKTDFINAFNHPNFAPPNVNPTSSDFGRVTASSGPGSLAGTSRVIQFHLQVEF